MPTDIAEQPSKGLEGVVVADTALSTVDGQRGRLVYRGHDAAVLAERQPFEAIWHLLYEGSLPDAARLARYRATIAQAGRLSAKEAAAVERASAASRGEPLAAVRTAVSAVAALRGLRPWLYRDLAEVRAEALALAASLPRIILLTDAASRGDRNAAAALGSETGDSVEQSVPSASYAARFLTGIHGRTPEPWQVQALDRYLALTVDHGMNASTFVARAVTSTGADLGAVVVAALAALSGPLHGGAPLGVLEMLEAIGTPEQADSWLRDEITAGRRIMGFGHRVYRTEDPRSRSLKQLALAHGGARAELALDVEQTAARLLQELKPGRELHPNVEFWAAVLLEACGVPPALFTAVFCCSRAVGWTAHALEQMADNRIMRPTARYVGPLPES